MGDAIRADSIEFADAPLHWAASPDASFSSLHQLSPYIGKLKPNIARELIANYTAPGEIVVDPFCGSGTIPLEAGLLGRRVLASDTNPYAYVLTKAKLSTPTSMEAACRSLDRVYAKSKQRLGVDIHEVPDWVRRFFDPQTLVETIAFADECLSGRHWFLLGCLLGILHHQRPGFLSYPSSHLVPYLRDKKYPRDEFPEMYQYRELLPRMRAKISRAFKSYFPVCSDEVVVRKSSIERLSLPQSIDAIITSPPYMNALDYRRDNRLRLWFLDRSIKDYSDEPTDKKAGLVRMVDSLVSQAGKSLRSGGSLILVVGESVTRKRIQSHPSFAFADALIETAQFSLRHAIRDSIPDVRRSRRLYQGTKAEHILVFAKN
jgi:DNA modification methylase